MSFEKDIRKPGIDKIGEEELLPEGDDLPNVVEGVTAEIPERDPTQEKLLERPQTGIASLLGAVEQKMVRFQIEKNPRLKEYYEKARMTLSGGKKGVEINRGQMINQLQVELTTGPIGEFAAIDELREIIRKVIAETDRALLMNID